MSGKARNKKRYAPVVEVLEVLRLLSTGATLLPPVTPLPAEHDVLAGPLPVGDQPTASDTWDTALQQTQLADLLGPAQSDADVQSGLAQLDRYLNRAWFRAGIAPQQHDDCTQAVYVTLLSNLGRGGFDHLLGDIGRMGIRDVLSRETPEGPDFFRAIDTVKKRAQRERTFQPLDDKADLAASSRDTGMTAQWHGALQEAITQSLSPREAALIYATLKGETPMEIANQWGVAPKTVSNEKTRVIQKLRDFLTTDTPD